MISIRVTSGGQTGVDAAALRAAKAVGLEVGGWAPKGWLTEDGPAPWLAEHGLKEHPSPQYSDRTKANVADADAVLWIGNPHSPGGRLTLRLAHERNLDVYTVVLGVTEPADVAKWWRRETEGGEGTLTLLVAGNRESKAPGIGAQAEAFLREVFRLLKGE